MNLESYNLTRSNFSNAEVGITIYSLHWDEKEGEIKRFTLPLIPSRKREGNLKIGLFNSSLRVCIPIEKRSLKSLELDVNVDSSLFSPAVREKIEEGEVNPPFNLLPEGGKVVLIYTFGIEKNSHKGLFRESFQHRALLSKVSSKKKYFK